MSAAHTLYPTVQLAADSAGEHRPLIITLFAAFVVATLFITVWAGRQTKSAADFYAGGRQFTGFQNGLAVSGDYMSAASFLGIAGAIALFGYDGFLYSIGFLVAWLVALLLVAEPLRNSGRYTMGDVLAYRMRQRPVRTAAGTSTIVVSIFYLLAQMAGAGVLVSLLLGITSDFGKIVIVALVGVLMILYVTIGGMKGTTWVQMVKAVLLIAGTLLITFLILLKFNFNISDLLGTAASNSGKGAAFLEPGLKYGADGVSKLDFISLGIALVLGTAGLPHILIRFYTVPTAKAARKSVNWAIGIIGAFYLMTIVLGFGAAAILNPDDIIASNKAGNTAAPLAALEIGGGSGSTGGAILLAVISGRRLRDHPRRRRRTHPRLLLVLRTRHLRQRDPQGAGHREGGGPRRTLGHRRHRCRLHRPRRPRPRPQRGRPRGPRLRGRRLRQPADDPLQPLLEAVHHAGGPLVHLRRALLLRPAGALLSGRLLQADLDVPERRLRLVPAGEPRPDLDPARLPARLARLGDRQGEGRHGQVRRTGGQVAHRHRSALREGIHGAVRFITHSRGRAAS